MICTECGAEMRQTNEPMKERRGEHIEGPVPFESDREADDFIEREFRAVVRDGGGAS